MTVPRKALSSDTELPTISVDFVFTICCRMKTILIILYTFSIRTPHFLYLQLFQAAFFNPSADSSGLHMLSEVDGIDLRKVTEGKLTADANTNMLLIRRVSAIIFANEHDIVCGAQISVVHVRRSLGQTVIGGTAQCGLSLDEFWH